MHDLLYWLQIIFLLLGILASCQIFTNAIENLGDKLNLNHEFTGSILAAVGTALPETILPLVAIYMASQTGSILAKNEIAIGAIIGAPFMLATLAMFLLGLSIFVHREYREKLFAKKNPENAKKYSTELKVNLNHVKRDLTFFLIIFSVAVGSSFFGTTYIAQFLNFLCGTKIGFQLLSILNLGDLTQIPTRCFDNVSFTLKLLTAALMIALYVIYLVQTYKASSAEIADEEDDTPELYFNKVFRLKETRFISVVVQTLIGLIGIIYFAQDFVHAIEHVSGLVAISPLVLSMIISPIATELPEKVNSWLWSSEGKDTLAIGNLTGAMVFQSTVPCLVGILLTPWGVDKHVLVCSAISIIAALALLLKIKFTNRVGYKTLLAIGSLYLVYLYFVFFG